MQISELLGAANDASVETRNAYLSFAAFAAYLAVTVGATTHQQLLVGGTVTMPVLGVGLPLVGFYVIAPALLVLLHANLLVQLSQLGERLRRLRAAVERDVPAGEAEAGIAIRLSYLRIHPFLVTQLILDALDDRVVRRLLYAGVWISVILVPTLILLFTQVRFLPYHSPAITTWHRILVLLDLTLVIWLWPAAMRPEGSLRRLRHIGLYVFTVVVALFAVAVAVLPERPVAAAGAVVTAPAGCEDNPIGGGAATDPAAQCPWWRLAHGRVAVAPAVGWGPPRRMLCLTWRLFEAPDTPLGMRRSLVLRESRLAVAPALGPDAADPIGERLAWESAGAGPDLRGRDLRFADFANADLRRANLRGADLSGANLHGARLGYALAEPLPAPAGECPTGVPVEDGGCRTRLVFADLRNADLTYAQLPQALASGANLAWSRMPGATWRGARLDGACIVDARMQGAFAAQTDFRGAALRLTHLPAAWLSGSRFDGASLAGTRLEGALARGVRLDGADLAGARLGAADLREAVLAGARLDGATQFGLADLRGAALPVDLARTFPDLAALGDEAADPPPLRDGADAATVAAWEQDLARRLARLVDCGEEGDLYLAAGVVRRVVEDPDARALEAPGRRPFGPEVARKVLAECRAVERGLDDFARATIRRLATEPPE